MFTQAAITLSPLLFGSLSGLATHKHVDNWYATLNAPSFKPSNKVFGPVWSALYLMMGYSSLRIYNSVHYLRDDALLFYGTQMALNLLWSPLFFGKHLLGTALVDIIALDVAVAYTINAFAQIDETAAWLMVPYMAWISFATVLNFEFWRLNSDTPRAPKAE
eukprot:NODE_394_length_8135_cov_0.672847.p5 type:complete len:162 gc:universal NODE_394_length_8135_cov_0.672847:1652-1167(-)